MNFATAMKTSAQSKLTENGAYAYKTTNQSGLLDLFAQIGALRSRDESEIAMKFAKAFANDPLLATKMMFYAGNIRGGLGERRTFRTCLKWMALNHADIVRKNIELIPAFNRYDSLFTLVGTPCEQDMWAYVNKTLCSDMMSVKKSQKSGKKPMISLLAKWMPSENASSNETRKMAMKAMKAMSMTPRNYRKMLTVLRKHLKVVESLMSSGKWDEISYAGVPSYAMHNYAKAFGRHDYERFNAYIQALNKGETKVNASVLYPYDLIHKYTGGSYYGRVGAVDPIIEAQWKALPNYVQGENNFVVMADVSGSMYGRPIESSVGLAIYFAERNKGAYHNMYMTFTGSPHFISLNEGATLAEKVTQVMRTDVGYNTNLEAAFNAILQTAINNRVPNEEMPKALVVISDMEIDRYMRPGRHWDFIQTMKAKFARYGYELPKIVLWNVEARNDTFLSQSEDVIFVSGQSVSTFKNLCGTLDGKTAWDFMLEVLNDKMYDVVTI